jgi:hypothetical protein
MVHIAARPRSQALAPFVSSFHYNEGELASAVERMLPTGQAHLMLNLDEDEFRTYSGTNCGIVHHTAGAVLAGPHGRPTAIDTREQRWLIGVEFKFGGAAAFCPCLSAGLATKSLNLKAFGNAMAFYSANVCVRRALWPTSSACSGLCCSKVWCGHGTRQSRLSTQKLMRLLRSTRLPKQSLAPLSVNSMWKHAASV